MGTLDTPSASLARITGPAEDAHLFRVRSLESVNAIRIWRRQRPELFDSLIKYDCFIVIGLLTTHSDLIPSLKQIYDRLHYAENSVRTHLRLMCAGGWSRFKHSPGGDRRSIGLQVTSSLSSVFDEYFALLGRFHSLRPDEYPSGATPQDGAGPGMPPRISA